MPREMITGQDGTFNAHVGWSPDKDVQIGIETMDGLTLKDIAQRVPEGVVDGWTGVWTTLDRHGINRMIKALRRARDAAYGRDE